MSKSDLLMVLRYCQKKHLNEAKNSHGMSQDVLNGIINCMPTARNFPEFHVHTILLRIIKI